MSYSSPKLSGLLDDIFKGINTGLGVYSVVTKPGTPAPPEPGCLQGQLTKDGSITACLNNVMIPWNATYDNKLYPDDQLLQQAVMIKANLDNPSLFGKATGDLTAARATLTDQIATLHARIDAATQAALVAVSAPSATGDLVNGIPNTYLIGGAGAAVLLLLLIKR